MSPAVSRLHYPASNGVLDAWWHVLATTYIMWVLLLVACPAFTCDMCKFPPLADLHGLPVPISSVSQCLDSVPLTYLVRVRNFRFCAGQSPFLRYPIIALLLLLAGDVEINPGPAALRFAHLNTNSISSISFKRDKPALLQDFVIDRDLELLSISETRLHENELPSTINSFTPTNYSFIHKPRPGSTGPGLPGGGVGFLFRSYLKLKTVQLPFFNSFESLCADFPVGSKFSKF